MKRAMTIRVLSAVLALAAFAMTSPSVAKPAPVPAIQWWGTVNPLAAATCVGFCAPESGIIEQSKLP